MAQTINCFNASAKRVNLLQKHSSLHPDCDSGKLIKLCTTQFVERHSSISRFWKNLPAVVSALHEMTTWTERDASIKAHTLLCYLEKSETLIGLACLNSIASIMKPLSEALQMRGGDLVRALHLVNNTAEVLMKMRGGSNDDESDVGREGSFSSIFRDVSSVADRLGVVLQKPRIPAGRCSQRAAAAADGTVEDYYRVNVFNAAIDAVLADFNSRFTSHFRLSVGLNSLLPSIIHNKTWEDVKDAYHKYE
jgi:hypothetical protein